MSKLQEVEAEKALNSLKANLPRDTPLKKIPRGICYSVFVTDTTMCLDNAAIIRAAYEKAAQGSDTYKYHFTGKFHLIMDKSDPLTPEKLSQCYESSVKYQATVDGNRELILHRSYNTGPVDI
jgi:hypothetical protein